MRRAAQGPGLIPGPRRPPRPQAVRGVPPPGLTLLTHPRGTRTGDARRNLPCEFPAALFLFKVADRADARVPGYALCRAGVARPDCPCRRFSSRLSGADVSSTI